MVAKPDIMTELESLQSKKLWHQLTLKLLAYVEDADVLEKEDLRKFYNEFIQPIENKMNPFTFMKIISAVITQFKNPEETITFLKGIESKIKDDKQAIIYCKILQGEILLEKLENKEDTAKILSDVEELLVDIDEIGFIHNRYYLLASQLYRVQGKHTEFYRTCLKYLGSLELETLNNKQQVKYAFLLTLAALLSDDIYNVGELLQHPILDSLKYNQNQWLVELLYAFNSGNLSKFTELKPKWSNIRDISLEQGKLRRKISLLCLMEMTFNKPAKERRFSFTEIANQTQLPLAEIELLVMKALSLGLVKGSIDQVAEEVHLHWVQPRVIDKSQISGMIASLDNWLVDLCDVKGHLTLKTSECE